MYGYFKGKAYWEIFRECKVSPGDIWPVSNGLTNGYSNGGPNGSVLQVQDSGPPGLYWTMLGGHMIPGVKHEFYQSRSLWVGHRFLIKMKLISLKWFISRDYLKK